MSKNQEIADIFDRIADALELQEADVFRINAYRKAARTLEEFTEDIAELDRRHELLTIPGIGKGMSEKIDEYLKTGRMAKYNEVLARIPAGLIDLLRIPNLGPKTIILAHQKLNVRNLADLKRAISDGSLEQVPGLGAKKVENIAKGIALYEQGAGRIPLGTALPLVEEIVAALQPGGATISPAGSLRRMKETVGDLDILAAAEDPKQLIAKFVSLPMVNNVLGQGGTKASVRVDRHHLQVDLRVVAPDEYGAALVYFTGSQAHNIALRGLAHEQQLKVSEYGVFRGEKRVAADTEEAVYRALGLAWIPPELREDRGEIAAAQQGALPVLVERADIKGDFHVHSNYSDGADDIKTMALAARQMGYEYIAISDHSRSLKVARGLDEDTLFRKLDEIDRVREEVPGIRILKGAEVDIRTDGSLDYDDKILERLDIVIAAVHQSFNKNVTERMKKAMDNPRVDMIAHPTGRLLSQREGYDLRLEEVIEYAALRGVALEINSYPDRLDLNDVNVLSARTAGARLAVNTDSHAAGMLHYMAFGVSVARRGWLERGDVFNTKTLSQVAKALGV